jgi:putative RecB family exonuclease
MAVEPPRTLSPTKVAAFTECALAFRFAAIDRLPEPPSPWATKGTLVHAALETLFTLPAGERTVERAVLAVAEAAERLRDHPEFTGLDLDPDAQAAFFAEAEELVRRYFRLEDPTLINPIGIELHLEAALGGVTVRGIIDRLELDDDGELVVTDYKTGKAPPERFEQGRLDGVHAYAFLCERLFGRRPARVQLHYLADPVTIICRPTDQSVRAIERKLGAVWQAVERACARDDFRPKPSRLCDYCAFRDYCPAFGGDPEEGRRVALALRAERAADRAAAQAGEVVAA